MSITSKTGLRDTLQVGLSVVTELWNYKAKDWVTSVDVVDIDNDGELEIIACSRDGRVHVLSHEGDCKWERVVGSKAWVGTVRGIPHLEGRHSRVRIIAGTRDGRIYALDQDGKTITRYGTSYTFGKDGRAIEQEREIEAFWLNIGAVIRQVYINPESTRDVIIGSQDGYAYAINYETGELHWKFPTNGWVRAVFVCDIDGDGKVEILIGSNEKCLYVLTNEGKYLHKVEMNHPIHAIFAADVDDDGETEVLVATDGKDLVALTPGFREKWHHSFDNRLLSLHVADIDKDGQSEIIAGSEDKHFYILNSQGKTLWRHYLGYRVFSVYAADCNNDGQIEILVGAEDARVHAFRVRLIKDLEKRIRSHYQALASSAQAIQVLLPSDELHLLQDILKEEVKQHVALKHINTKDAEKLIVARKYREALSQLVKLEENKVQILWRKEKKDKLGYVRSLCFGHLSDRKREIVVGTNEGDIRVYNSGGRLLWSLHLGDRLLDVQTGFIERGRWEDIVVCSSDHKVYIVSGNATKQEKRHLPLDDETACIYVAGGNRYRPSEILVGAEKKIDVYSGDLQAPVSTIPLSEEVRRVHAHIQNDADMPEIIAGSTNRSVHAFTLKGEFLWKYEMWDRVEAVDLKDIDNDGNVEVIVGGEDRNVYVLDSKGQLRWRYFLPHSVLALQALDIDQDGRVEIVVGCADGYLYVFSREGDLLWKYKSNDRIRAIKATDIDDDGNIEIAVGSEDELELLQVVNQQHVRNLIYQCWSELQRETSSREVITELLQSPESALRALAIKKLTEQTDFMQSDLDVLERFVKDGFAEVRKSLLFAVARNYAINPQKAQQLLHQLSQDIDQDVKLTFVEHMPLLMQNFWDLGFEYLKRLSRSSDRLIRRSVVRKLYQLIDISQERTRDEAIFALLLIAAQDHESEWIRQEAARSLAHFLSNHQGGLIVYMHLFIVRKLPPPILQLIARQTTSSVAQRFIKAVLPLLTDLKEKNVLTMLDQVVAVLEDMRSLKFGNDAWLIYDQLRLLFTINTIDSIAHYECTLDTGWFTSDNQLAQIILNVFEKLNPITRILNIYLRREGVNDRLSSLLEAITAIDKMNIFLEQEYSLSLLGVPISELPDRYLFQLLLERWHKTILAELNELRGKAELKAELQTKSAPYEELVGVWLKMSNTGRGSADNVKITLLYSKDFDVVSTNTFETETIFSQGTMQVEFTISPHVANMDLVFEIFYDDAERQLKELRFGDRLELETLTALQEFCYIPNPYSTGTPIHDSTMFYGRDKDIAYLKENLAKTAAQTVIVLHGQRRFGKTTLLLQLVNMSVLDDHIPVLIDMQREAYKMTESKFLRNISYYIARETQKKGISVCVPQTEDFARDPTFTFGVFLDEVDIKLNKYKLILLIDEFEVLEEQINKKTLDLELLGYLRSMMQHHPSINFLFSGTHKIEELTQGHWSVFFNIARQYKLSRLNGKGAEDLIKKPVEGYLEYDPFALEKIRQLTADQPYLIHLLCRSLVDHCNEKRKVYVTINDVNIVLHEVMLTCRSYFEWTWKQLSSEEQIALAAIAESGKEEGRLLSYVEIENVYRMYRLPYSHERLQFGLNSLIEAELIESVPGDVRTSTLGGVRYRVPVGLMRTWLCKEKQPRLIIEEKIQVGIQTSDIQDRDRR